MKFFNSNHICHVRFSGKFCSILYVPLILKVISITNIKLFLKVWKIEKTEQKKYITILRKAQASWDLLSPVDPLLLKLVFHNFDLFIFRYPISNLIWSELLSRWLSSLISLLSMIANSSTYSFYLGKQGSLTVIQKSCKRTHAITGYFDFPVHIRFFYILFWSCLLT